VGDMLTSSIEGDETPASNVSGLIPATQYAVKVRNRNAEGWGDWSHSAWLSTIPAVPAAPDRPTCDTLRNNEDRLYIQMKVANGNGIPILDYEVRVAFDNTFSHSFLVSPSTDLAYAYVNASMPPETEYSVQTRARNDLGWGPWSELAGDTCVTTPPKNWFNLLYLVVPLGAAVLLLCCCLCLWKCTDLPKVLAPKLRQVDRDDPLEDFIAREDAPMEDLDPELTLNPVILAKMEMQRARGAKKNGKGKKANAPVGAFKKLGIRISGSQPEEPQTKRGLKQIDYALAKDNKPMSPGSAKAYEQRRLAQRPGVHERKKTEKNRNMIADRMIAQARDTDLTVAKRNMARAAARFGDGGMTPRYDGGAYTNVL
jgi:hypothetical protein